MRKFFLGVLLLPFLAAAEPVEVDKPVTCDDLKIVFTGLVEGKYKEIPIWLGESKNSMFSVFVNPNSNTWTIVQFNKDTACILGEGIGFKQRAAEQ